MCLISLVYLLAGFLHVLCQTRWTTAEDTNLPHLQKRNEIQELEIKGHSFCLDSMKVR